MVIRSRLAVVSNRRFDSVPLANHLDSRGQPMSFATATRANSGAGSVPYSGHTVDRDPTGAQRVIVGATSIDHTVQDVGKIRLVMTSGRKAG